MSKNTNTETPAQVPPATDVLTPENVLDAYRAADGTKGRNAVRRDAETARDAAIDALNMESASAWVAAIRTLTVAQTPASRPATDWVGVTGGVIADLTALADALMAGTVRVPGCPDDIDLTDVDAISTAAQAVRDGLTPDRATVTDRVLAACKIAGTGPRASVQSVFDAAFDGTDADTVLTVAEICNRAGYPHPGAVAARLTGVVTLKGYVSVPATTDRALGAQRG